MSINSRIKKIRKDFFNDSNIEFAKALNKSKQYASNLTSEGKSVGKNVIENLTSIIPDLNVSWLLTGEGEMLKTSNANVRSVSISGDYNITNAGVTGGDIIIGSDQEVKLLRRRNKDLEEENEQLKKDKTILQEFTTFLQNKK